MLTRLYCQNIRCIESAEIQPGSLVNIIYGENGAGKTSLLEAIHVLSTGRSFRTPHIRDVIQHNKDSLVVAGTIHDDNQTAINLGIQRWKDRVKARINQQPVQHIASLSTELPIIAFHPGSSRLVTEEPGERRAYLDWGVFQFIPGFLTDWRQYRRVLKQRNIVLKERKPAHEISLWDKQLSDAAEMIHKKRSTYISTLQDSLPGIAKHFTLPFQLNIEYRPGWNIDIPYIDVLRENLNRDISLGYTYAGPHRADLKVILDKHPAAAVASRGQLKLVTIMLKLLQAQLYHEQTDKKAILLLDDLPSEFDKHHLAETCQSLDIQQSQIFITMVEPDDSLFKSSDTKMFHVEHGLISPH